MAISRRIFRGMTQKTSFIFFILFSFLSGSLSAQESGLLLGLRSSKEQKGVETTSYRTLWITPQDGKIGVVTEKEGIYLPRKDGFWKVDVVAQQASKANTRYSEEMLVAAPLSQKPYLRSINLKEVRNCEGGQGRMLLFVGQDYLAVDEGGVQDCKGMVHPGAWSTLSILSIDKISNRAFPDLSRLPVNISQLLGTKADRALQQSCEEEGNDCSKGSGELSLALTRNEGKWTTLGRLAVNWGVGRGSHEDFDVDFVPPASLVGDNRLSPDFPTIQKWVPQAVDAFSSPSGDLLVVLIPSEIQVFTPKGNALGPCVLKLPLKNQEAAVMAQWALGKNVPRWSKILLPPQTASIPKMN